MFLFEYMIFFNHPRKRVLRNIRLSNLENVLQINLVNKCFIKKETKPRTAFLKYLEVQMLKIYPLTTNHAGAYVGSICVSVCPKNSGYVSV